MPGICRAHDVILGAGVTGLAAARSSGFTVFEATDSPGGICSSYYQRPGSTVRLATAPEDGDAYRFEHGGGHWIFGGDPLVLDFLEHLTPMGSYRRKAAVYFPEQRLLVPYPLQYHLSALGPDVAARALKEMLDASSRTSSPPSRMSDWIEHSFGPTLTKLFFAPFHEAYTAGLWTEIAPQDTFKSPVDRAMAIRGASGESQAAGYNVTFRYPDQGLGATAVAMARSSDIRYGQYVVSVDAHNKQILFADGSGLHYDRLISTLPLNRMLSLARTELDSIPGPSTSVLVLNIGGRKGPHCPDVHWLYVPTSRSGFFRVGFYSNVHSSFLPRVHEDRVSLYVERGFRDGNKSSPEEVARYSQAVVKELREWRIIGEVDVISPTWIEVAYTWEHPGSDWRSAGLARLASQGIVMAGRYARWHFQGIAESVSEGFSAGAAARRRVVPAGGIA
jgi:protoporphyrinogen oxidase